eukprot:4279851-Alexandrium_andersonii.AAC.1
MRSTSCESSSAVGGVLSSMRRRPLGGLEARLPVDPPSARGDPVAEGLRLPPIGTTGKEDSPGG